MTNSRSGEGPGSGGGPAPGNGPRVPRLHVEADLADGAEIELDRARSHQLGEVLRVREGAAVAVFDGAGAERAARVSVAGKRVRLTLGAAVAPVPESPLRIVLLQGVSRGDRMDATVRQATELGAAAIVPVATRRGSVRLDAARAAKRLAHWRAVVVSACEQCGRARLPELHPVATLEAALASADASRGPALAPSLAPALALQLDPAARSGLGAALERAAAAPDAPPRSAALLIGPESGLDPDEIAAAGAAGFEPVTCGPRVLRTETAGPAVIAMLQARFGDLSR